MYRNSLNSRPRSLEGLEDVMFEGCKSSETSCQLNELKRNEMTDKYLKECVWPTDDGEKNHQCSFDSVIFDRNTNSSIRFGQNESRLSFTNEFDQLYRFKEQLMKNKSQWQLPENAKDYKDTGLNYQRRDSRGEHYSNSSLQYYQYERPVGSDLRPDAAEFAPFDKRTYCDNWRYGSHVQNKAIHKSFTSGSYDGGRKYISSFEPTKSIGSAYSNRLFTLPRGTGPRIYSRSKNTAHERQPYQLDTLSSSLNIFNRELPLLQKTQSAQTEDHNEKRSSINKKALTDSFLNGKKKKTVVEQIAERVMKRVIRLVCEDIDEVRTKKDACVFTEDVEYDAITNGNLSFQSAKDDMDDLTDTKSPLLKRLSTLSLKSELYSRF